MDNDYTPQLESLRIIKLLYKTKLSKIWLVQSENEELNSQFFILKGKHMKSLNQYDIDSFKRERKFLELNKTDFFPKFIKAYKDSEYVYILLNFFEGIPLSAIISEDIILLNEFNLKEFSDFYEKKEIFTFISYQLALMILELNKNNYLHRDIKLNNIIINKTLKINLIDFGFWKNLEKKDDRTNTFCGTFHSMAPEIFLVENKNYGLEVDVYSFGVFLYEFFTRNSPFPYFYKDSDLDDFKTNNDEKSNLNDKDFDSFLNKAHKYYFKYNKNLDFKVKENDGIFYGVKNHNEYENSITSSLSNNEEKLYNDMKNYVFNLKNLIENCMKFDPNQRLTAEEVLKHEFFKNFDYLKTANKYDKFNNFKKNHVNGYDSCLSELLELISYNGEFKEEYDLNTQFEDIFDKYF